MTISNRIALIILGAYRKCISPFLPPSCRFNPTCSEYAVQSFKKYSFFVAMKYSFLRIMKCHPFHPGGEDPLP